MQINQIIKNLLIKSEFALDLSQRSMDLLNGGQAGNYSSGEFIKQFEEKHIIAAVTGNFNDDSLSSLPFSAHGTGLASDHRLAVVGRVMAGQETMFSAESSAINVAVNRMSLWESPLVGHAVVQTMAGVANAIYHQRNQVLIG